MNIIIHGQKHALAPIAKEWIYFPWSGHYHIAHDLKA